MNPLEATVATLGVIMFVAFLAESLVEYLFGEPFNHSEKLAEYKWVLRYIAAAVGVGLAWHYKFDLVSLLSQFFGNPDASPSIAGVIITGLAMGRGAGFLHDIVGKWFSQS